MGRCPLPRQIAISRPVRLNIHMAKTQKELAFLRDLYICSDWTSRFTDLIDKHLEIEGAENILYLNAGTGSHAFAVRDKVDERTAVFATCENEDILNIARDKALAVKSDIDFSMLRFDDDAFDAVLADASFVRPNEMTDFVEDAVRVTRPGGSCGIMMTSAGSFGEIFSLLWEVLFEEDLGEHGAAAEAMITELPTLSQIEQMAADAGLEEIRTFSANEVFEYKNGADFVNSPLVSDFLLPVWLERVGEDDRERVTSKLAQLIDKEDGEMSFRFSVKATLLTGEKQ